MIAPDDGPRPDRADTHSPAEAVESTLRVAVLGRLAATARGRDLNLGGPRQRAVFARLLAARGKVVTGDQLTDSLWGDAPPQGSAGTLQVYVSRLRREFEPDRIARDRRGVIVSEGSGYAVRLPENAVDAWQFEDLLNHAARLTESADAAAVLSGALALWHGPAFAGFVDEPWARLEADRLGGLREVARERLLAARLECGESAAVVPEAEALVAEQPLREERWCLLALSLYRSHRQADALAALRRARRTLADELGIDPGPALRRLEDEVLAQSPGLDAPMPPPPPLLPPSDHLVDRDREVTELRRCLADVLAGRAGFVCLEGSAGIGKSRLLVETRRLAAGQGILTLAARGSRLEKDYGFGVVRQLLDPVVAGRGSELLAGTAAAAATVFDGQDPPGPSRPESFAVLQSLYRLIVRLAEEQPLVIAVDDLQWCDTGSLRFLAYLAPRIEGLPVLIATTLRTGEPHDDEQLLADLTGDPLATHIRPRPLSPQGVAALVRRRLGERADDLFVTTCHRTTGGNPLLLRQLLGALASEGVRPDATAAGTVAAVGSRAVSSLVLVRLAQLPDAATAVAQAIAVLGDGAALPVVATFTELSEHAVAAATALLVRVEVLRDEYPLGFAHPLVADAVHRNVQAGELQLQHGRAARVLHAAGAAPEQIAAHLLLVPHRGEPWTVDVLRAAAARAAARGASDVATTYLTRALLEPPAPDLRPEVLVELGRAEAAGNGPAASRYLREAYETLSDPTRRVAVAQTLVRILTFAGSPGESTAFAQLAARDLPAELVDGRQGLLALERSGAFLHGLAPELWWECDDVPVVGDGPGARMLAACLAREATVKLLDRRRAVDLARFALTDRSLLEDGVETMWASAIVALHLADEDVSRLLDEASAFAAQRGSLFLAQAIHKWKGWTQWRHGDLRTSHESLTTSLSQFDAWTPSPGTPHGPAYMVGVLLDLGDTAGARAYLGRLRAHIDGPEGTRLLGESQARVLIAEGRHTEALTALDDVGHLQPPVMNPVWWDGGLLRVRALTGLGEQDRAVTLAREQLTLARAWGAPTTLGRVLRLLGEARGADGGAELREAVSVLAPGRAALEHARALYALALHSPPEDTVPLLTRAQRIARQCGAAGLCRPIAARLDAAGGSPG